MREELVAPLGGRDSEHGLEWLWSPVGSSKADQRGKGVPDKGVNASRVERQRSTGQSVGWLGP